MATPPTIREQTYSYFLIEAQDLLQGMEQDLLSLRTDRSPAKVHSLMRAAHTLKGGAASVGFESMKTMAHTLEDVFKAFYKPEVEIDSELEALLFEGYECLRSPLTSVLAGLESHDDEVLERAATLFAQLQKKLGKHFDPGATIPSSAELGFDITQSIFETGVCQRLEQLATALAQSDEALIAQVLQTQAEVFVGLAESLSLPGFESIAQTTLTALKANPDQVRAIAQAAIADFQQGQIAVVGGDRTRGGEPSAALKQFVKRAKPTQTKVSANPSIKERGPFGKSDFTKSWSQLIAFLNRPLWRKPSPAQITVPKANFIISKPSSQPVPSEIQETLEETVSMDSALEELANRLEPSETTQDFNTLEGSEANEFELWDKPWETPELVSLDGPLEIIDAPSNRYPQPPDLVPTIAPSSPAQTTITATTIRVDLEHLDSLNYSTSELLINQNRQALQDERLQLMIQDLLNELRQHQQTMTELRDWSDQQLTLPEKGQRSGEFSGLITKNNELKTKFDSLELDRHSELQVLSHSALEELVRLDNSAEAIEQLAREASQSLKKQRLLIANVRDDLMAVRMVPVGTVLNRFTRVLQQLIETHGKTVHLELKGTQVLVDKAVAEKLYDSLLHLVRNAFDHGIESSHDRHQTGKSATGHIKIHAYQQGNRTLIDVSDDGRGLDLKKICQRGYELQRLSSDQVDHFSEAELLDLLFEPGFSTTDQVSDLSGRGVGLDVVRSQLQSLKGSVSVSSTLNQGTTFSLQLPLTLMSARLLVCQVGQAVYALLSDEVEKILAPQLVQVETIANKRMLHWNQGGTEQPIPLYQLAQLVHYATAPATPKDTFHNGFSSVLTADAAPILLIHKQSGLIGVEVDRILGEQELVIQPMGTAIAPPNYVYGCSILGDGQLMLVIDGAALVQQGGNLPVQQSPLDLASELAALRTSDSPPVGSPQLAAPVQTTVLVVDDSMTVRQMLTLTLQSAGYHVLHAQDGLEAIAQLQQHRDIRLVTCDVEMPRLNGFEFLMRYRQEPALIPVPVVMLTSRSNDKHQQLATQLGASAYLTKPYAEQMLLEMVAELIAKASVKIRAS
ncbi:MAG: response regulator [Phormidesmis sp. CAN_BIN36]|nr:response regulator [Phormidesmis sp. CAN_BIN36]